VTASILSTCAAALGAEKRPGIDGGECQAETLPSETVLQSDPFILPAQRGANIRAKLIIKRLSGPKIHCRVVYQLLVENAGQLPATVEQVILEVEEGEIAGVDLIGVSPTGDIFAADFWTAEGDGTAHQPVIYDVRRNSAIYLPLEDRIQKRIHGCDQVEDFIGVTNLGEAIFAVPPSTYDKSPGCGDKGVWRFNLKTGRVYRVAKFSGVKWQ